MGGYLPFLVDEKKEMFFHSNEGNGIIQPFCFHIYLKNNKIHRTKL